MIERVQVLIEIREERSNDVAAVRGVNRRAFGQEQGKEYRRCALRTNEPALLSVVEAGFTGLCKI
jgi:predicted N-acetyltransferase YhbS